MVELLGRGSSYRQVATDLGIALGTVKNHAQHAYEKLEAHTASEAFALARSSGT